MNSWFDGRYRRMGSSRGRKEAPALGVLSSLMSRALTSLVSSTASDALGVLGQRSNILALGVDGAQAEVADGKGDERADETDDDDSADVSAQQDGDGEDAGGGRNQTVGQGQAEVDEGSNLLHTHLLRWQGWQRWGVQDDGNVAEDGDAHDEASQGRCQLEAF